MRDVDNFVENISPRNSVELKSVAAMQSSFHVKRPSASVDRHVSNYISGVLHSPQSPVYRASASHHTCAARRKLDHDGQALPSQTKPLVSDSVVERTTKPSCG